jgi:hypothetical protein
LADVLLMGSSDKDSGIRCAEFAAALIRAGSDDRQALQFVYEATPAKLLALCFKPTADLPAAAYSSSSIKIRWRDWHCLLRANELHKLA